MAKRSAKKPRKKSAKHAAAARRNGKKGGRPSKQIDWVEFDKLCALQCTLVEIAGWFECDVNTIEKACKRELGMGFSDAFEIKRSKGKVSLRRRQYQAAMEGDKTMLVWLGKQWLDQRDKQETYEHHQGKVDVVLVHGDNKRDRN